MLFELLNEQNLISLVASGDKSARAQHVCMIVLPIHSYKIAITNQCVASWKFCNKNNPCCNFDDQKPIDTHLN